MGDVGNTVKMYDIMTFRGKRELWLDFVHKVKKDRKRVWEVLSPFLKKYIRTDDETRVLLLLFPKALVDELLNKEDPDKFITEAIQKHLSQE